MPSSNVPLRETAAMALATKIERIAGAVAQP